jgi:hypothetical protein
MKPMLRALSILLAIPAPVLACPPLEVGLWARIAASDRVVLGRVERIVPLDGAEPDNRRSEKLTELAVSETWKGDHDPFLRVRGSGYGSPLADGTPVIAFLVSRETRLAHAVSPHAIPDAVTAMARPADEWTFVLDGYGQIVIEEGDVSAFREAIREAVRLREPDVAHPTRVFDLLDERPPIEWIVRTAARRGTRWYGLRHLPLDDVVSSLTDGHREVLAQGFVREPSADATLPQMLSILEGHDGHEVDEAAVAAVQAVLERPQTLFFASEAVRLVLARYGDSAAARALAAAEDEEDGILDDGSELETTESDAVEEIDAETAERQRNDAQAKELETLKELFEQGRRELGIPYVRTLETQRPREQRRLQRAATRRRVDGHNEQDPANARFRGGSRYRLAGRRAPRAGPHKAPHRHDQEHARHQDARAADAKRPLRAPGPDPADARAVGSGCVRKAIDEVDR